MSERERPIKLRDIAERNLPECEYQTDFERFGEAGVKTCKDFALEFQRWVKNADRTTEFDYPTCYCAMRLMDRFLECLEASNE